MPFLYYKNGTIFSDFFVVLKKAIIQDSFIGDLPTGFIFTSISSSSSSDKSELRTNTNVSHLEDLSRLK